MKELQKYNKLWMALAGGVVTVLTQYYGKSSTITTMATTLLTALGVFTVANK